MSVCVVNDYRLKEDGDRQEALAAAGELVEYFEAEHPGVELSLWLEDKDEPLHHFHITIFDDEESFSAAVESEGIARFIERFYPHMDRSTHLAPLCDVWLTGGSGVEPVELEQG